MLLITASSAFHQRAMVSVVIVQTYYLKIIKVKWINFFLKIDNKLKMIIIKLINLKRNETANSEYFRKKKVFSGNGDAHRGARNNSMVILNVTK